MHNYVVKGFALFQCGIKISGGYRCLSQAIICRPPIIKTLCERSVSFKKFVFIVNVNISHQIQQAYNFVNYCSFFEQKMQRIIRFLKESADDFVSV